MEADWGPHEVQFSVAGKICSYSQHIEYSTYCGLVTHMTTQIWVKFSYGNDLLPGDATIIWTYVDLSSI